MIKTKGYFFVKYSVFLKILKTYSNLITDM